MSEWKPEEIEPLIAALESDDFFTRLNAIEQLSELTKFTFGFRFNASESEREQAVGRWKDWWKEQQREKETQGQLKAAVQLSGGMLDVEALKKAIKEIPPDKIQGYLNALMMKLKVTELKCESCGVRTAAVTVTELDGGKYRSRSLCDICAEERGDLLA